MVSRFYAFIDKIKSENINMRTEISYQFPQIKTSFIIETNKNGINSSLMDFDLFSNTSISVFIDGKTPKDNLHFREIIQTELDRKDHISILFSYSQSFDLKDTQIEQIEITLYNTDIYSAFIKSIASIFCIDDLSSLKYKISISCHEIEDAADTELLTFNHSNQMLTNETLNYIKSLHNREASIFTIPNSLPQNIELKSVLKIIPDLLSQLATNHSDKHFRFIGKRVIIFNTDNIDKLNEPNILFNILTKTIKFVYEDTKTTDQKLTFYRKTLIDGYLKDETFNILELETDFFEKLYIEAENVYDAFQDEAVSTFLKEKKEIIKEYMNISREVISAINNLKNSLIRTLITLLALLISNIALKNKGITASSDYTLITMVTSLFLVVLIAIHFINDVSLKSTILKRIDIFDEHFKFISASSKNLKDSIKYTVESEIKKFNLLLDFVGTLYILLFAIFFSILISILVY